MGGSRQGRANCDGAQRLPPIAAPRALACVLRLIFFLLATIMLSLLLTPTRSLCLSLCREMIGSRCRHGNPVESITVVVNRVRATTGHRLSTTRLFLWCLRLLLHVRVTTALIACEILRRN